MELKEEIKTLANYIISSKNNIHLVEGNRRVGKSELLEYIKAGIVVDQFKFGKNIKCIYLNSTFKGSDYLGTSSRDTNIIVLLDDLKDLKVLFEIYETIINRCKSLKIVASTYMNHVIRDNYMYIYNHYYLL